MIRRIKSIRAVFLAVVLCAMAFALQACLLGGDSSGGGGLNGRWLHVRDIQVFSDGGTSSVSDTVVASTGTFAGTFLVIQDSTFSAVYYDQELEKADTIEIYSEVIGGKSWYLGDDSVTVERVGNILRISSFPEEGITEISEFSLFTAAFPPAAWAGIQAPVTGGELWQFKLQVYTWSDGGDSEVDTFDFEANNVIGLLRIKGDTLAIHGEFSSTVIGTDRVNATTWNLFEDEEFVIVSRTTTEMVAVVSGYDAEFGETYSVRITFTPYTQAFPPPIWSVVDSTEPNNTSSQAVSLIAGGGQQAAKLTLGDTDWFSFQAVSGTFYTIKTTGGTDTYLRLYGTNGTTLLEESDGYGDDWMDAGIDWVAPSSGRYYFTVRGYQDEVAGSYSVGVTVSSLAKPASLPVQPKRARHWFR